MRIIYWMLIINIQIEWKETNTFKESFYKRKSNLHKYYTCVDYDEVKGGVFMYGEMLLTLIFLAIIMAIYLNNRKNMIAENNKTMTYDLIIKFNNDNYVDIRKIEYFKDIAGWVRYGEYGFRGNSVLNKDLLEEFVVETLNISKDSFRVISPTQFYIPS